jgi:large subunit ribosomal protein L29
VPRDAAEARLMSTGKLKEMRQKEDKELELDLAAFKKELFDLRFQSTTEKLANPSRITQIRRDMARIKTLLREREGASQRNAQQNAQQDEG